ncbi:cation:proton antiporter subunit C [Streptomyces sp. NPDC006365]|uniref:cation:proton antiporter subunit C n=1 Tax=Streptomyces sp. NPDC006365 TaxID=3364744 RepID=UPI00368E7903
MIATHYVYWTFFALMLIGLYVVISHGNLLKKLIGLSLFQVGVFLFYIGLGKRDGGSAPIISDDVETYSHPLPQVLILTAIVVGVATLAVGLALAVRIFEAYGTVEEDEITEDDSTGPDCSESADDDGANDDSPGSDGTGRPHDTDRQGSGS